MDNLERGNATCPLNGVRHRKRIKSLVYLDVFITFCYQEGSSLVNIYSNYAYKTR